MHEFSSIVAMFINMPIRSILSLVFKSSPPLTIFLSSVRDICVSVRYFCFMDFSTILAGL